MSFLYFLQYKFGANPYALKFLTSYEKVSGASSRNRIYNMDKDIGINQCPSLVFDTDTV